MHIFVPTGQLEPHRQCFQHERGILLVPCYEGTNSFTPSPTKMDFWPKTGIFSPFDTMPNQKAMRKRCLGGSSFMWVPKLDFGPKNGQIWPKICICGHFGPNIGLYGEFGAMPNQKTTRTMCLVGFPLCGYQNFTFSRNIWDFWPKEGQILPKIGIFGPKYAFLDILGQILAYTIHLVICMTIKQCKEGASVVF